MDHYRRGGAVGGADVSIVIIPGRRGPSFREQAEEEAVKRSLRGGERDAFIESAVWSQERLGQDMNVCAYIAGLISFPLLIAMIVAAIELFGGK